MHSAIRGTLKPGFGIVSSPLPGTWITGPEDSKRVIRTFLSSTFTDTEIERNLLLQLVMPFVHHCARNRSFEVILSEMRFGIRDESSNQHETARICMEELQRCESDSAGLFYIFIATDKYGWRPFPSRIPKDEFEALVSHMSASEGASAHECFKLDLNSMDETCTPAPEYVLQNSQSMPDSGTSSECCR
jgi:hypothetical protein